MTQLHTGSPPGIGHDNGMRIIQDVLTGLFRDDESLEGKAAIVLVKRAEVEAAELALKDAEEAAYNAEQALMSDMTAQNLTQFKTGAGQVVKIEERTWPSVLAADRPSQFEWLREMGLGNLIEQKESVNAQTFAAEVRQRITAGETLPEWIKVSVEKKLKIKGESK